MTHLNHQVVGRAYRRLARRAECEPDPDRAWRVLMAAHIVGQQQLRWHWDSHRRMLRLARRQRDWREVVGQLLRLALTPVGHALGRLPPGNVGRSTVSPFRPMVPPADVQDLVDWAAS